MPRLIDPRLEHVAQLLFAGKNAAEASRGAGFPDEATSFASNARRRANRKDVKARVAELQDRAAQAAEVDKTFILLELKNLLAYNLDDYLTAVDVNHDGELIERQVDIGRCSREQLGRVAEFAQVVTRLGGKKKSLVTAVSTKLKPYDKVSILAQLAKTAGIDRDQVADALDGIGERLNAALERQARLREERGQAKAS